MDWGVFEILGGYEEIPGNRGYESWCFESFTHVSRSVAWFGMIQVVWFRFWSSGERGGMDVPTYISESTYISHNRSPSFRTKLSFSDCLSVEIFERVLSLQHISLLSKVSNLINEITPASVPDNLAYPSDVPSVISPVTLPGKVHEDLDPYTYLHSEESGLGLPHKDRD